MDTQTLQTKDFDFELPEELIAQTPIEPRDASRLMVLDKTTGEIEHRHFHDITEYLNEGDCLVLNNSRVLPARIYGIKNETGAHVEFLLLKNCGDDVWEALAGPGKRAKVERMGSVSEILIPIDLAMLHATEDEPDGEEAFNG